MNSGKKRGVKGALTRRVLMGALALPIASSAQSAGAEEGSADVSRLPEIVVSETYVADTYHPFTFTEIDQAELKPQLFGQEPAFVLARTPSVLFHSDSGSYQGYSYFRLRGIDQTRINMTLDGVPLNEPEDQGAYFSNYPDFLNSVSQVQLVRGVGLSQNGTASYGGSLHFESADLAAPARTELGAGGGSFGTARTFAQYSSGPEDDGVSVYVRAAGIHSDGYRRRSANDSQSLFYKVGTTDTSDQWFVSGFVGHQANQMAWLGATREEIAEDPRFNANTNEDDEFTQSLTQVRNVRTDAAGNVLTSSVYYNHLQGGYDFDLNNFLGLPSTPELYRYNFNSHFVGAFSNYQAKLDDTKVTVGAHGNMYEREHVGTERALGQLYRNNGRKSEGSVFTRLEQTVGDFIFLSDLQGRYTEFSYVGSQELPATHWAFFNPKGGVTYGVTNSTDLYYSVGRTGREPTRNDILAGNDDAIVGEDGAVILGPTSAEHVVDHELGVRVRGDEWNVKANTFYMDFDQEIVLAGEVGPNGLPLTQSVDSSYRSGVELEYDYAPAAGVTLFGNASYNYAKMEQSGLEFKPVMTPRWMANQGASYTWDRLTVRADVRYQSSAYIDFANTTKIDGFAVTDLMLGYTFEDVSIGVHVNNVFSERYFSNGYVDFNGDARYFIQAPRNLFVSATWKL